jgi:acyl-CoA-binding protein
VRFVEKATAATTPSEQQQQQQQQQQSNGGDTTTPPLPTLSDEARLLFYALGRQATDGACSDPKPWGWDVVAAAKWQSWAQLGAMPRLEAMRLYVKTLEEEAPGWGAFLAAMGDDEDADGGSTSQQQQQQQRVEELGRSLSSAGGGGGSKDGRGDKTTTATAKPAQPPTKPQQQQQHPILPPNAHPSASVVTTLRDACVPGRWVALQLPEGARRPTARYEHAAALMDGRLYVVGGHLRGGRAMADVWAFDLERLAWTPLCVGVGGVAGADALPGGVPALPVSGGQRPPALIGHTVTPYRGKLVVVGGHVRLGGSGGSGSNGAKASGGDEAKAPAAPAPSSSTTRPRPRNRAEAAGYADAWVFDPAEQQWTHLQPASPLDPSPCARGAHTAVALGGSELHVYGGEDASRRPLGDLWRLDLDAAVASGVAAWKCLDPVAVAVPAAADAAAAAAAGGSGSGGDGGAVDGGSGSTTAHRRGSRFLPLPPPQPLPRSAHAAVAYQDRYMVVYGGAAMGSGCHDDTWVFDRETGAWSQPSTEHGAKPGARAGHGGARLGEAWFVLGGGDHVRGCRDVLAADLSQLPAGSVTWSRVSTVPARSPLSSEGASVSAVPQLGALLAFGGYNGRCHDSLSLYKARDEMIEPPGSPQAKAAAKATAAFGGGKEDGTATANTTGNGNGGAGPSDNNAAAAESQAPLFTSLGRAVSALFGSSSNLKTAASEGGGAGAVVMGQPQPAGEQAAAAAAPPAPLAPNGSGPAELAATAAATKSARIREEAEAAVAAAEKAEEQQQLRRALSPDAGGNEDDGAAASPGSSSSARNQRTPHEQALLRDLAVQREVLRRELRAAREELTEARRERDVEVAALKRALADAHRQLADEQRRAEALEGELAEVKAKAAPGEGEAAAATEASAATAAAEAAEAEAAAAAARARREEEAEARAQAAVVAGGGGVWGLFASSGAAR